MTNLWYNVSWANLLTSLLKTTGLLAAVRVYVVTSRRIMEVEFFYEQKKKTDIKTRFYAFNFCGCGIFFSRRYGFDFSLFQKS